MARFLLVHGAWHGGWCWQELAEILRAEGHEVWTPTLTGLGERQHLLSAEITPDTHATDIVNLIRWRGLSDLILVGHSYGGLVITGAAGQVPEAVRAMIYLDAMVPERSGEAIFATAAPERMAGFQAQIKAGAIGLEVDAASKNWSSDPEKLKWIRAQSTPHPKGCFEQGVTLTGREAEVAHRHYILCTHNRPSLFWKVHERIKDRPGWTTEEMPSMHDAMVDHPQDLARRLAAYAATLPEPAA